MNQLPLRIGLNDPPTFENFFGKERPEGPEILREHARGKRVGPLVYLHGQTGSGKTHLLAACIHEATEFGHRAVGVSLSEPGQAAPELLEGLDESGLVVIDDIDVCMGIPEWEEALFHLYGRVENSATRFVVASRHGPRASRVRLPDLGSRLRGAFSVRLLPLSEPEQREALAARASSRGFAMGEEVLEYLLRRARRDMHTLMGYLDRLDVVSLAEKRRITVPLLREVLHAAVTEEQAP